MKNLKLKKGLVALTSAALVAAFAVAIPSAARAADAPTCTTVSKVETCKGVDDNGSNYEIRMPAKFNGTLFVYSHGYRYNVNLPAIPVVEPKGSLVDKTAAISPSEEVSTALLAQGFALAGSAGQRQGWNIPEGIDAAFQVLQIAKEKYTKISKVVTWGNSVGGLTAQAVAEQYSGAVDAVAPMCISDETQAVLDKANGFLWGFKQFFNPAIKGSNYSPGQIGYGEMIADLVAVLQTSLALKDAITANPSAPAWPATSTVPATLKALPVRSAILMLGLINGIPTQSNAYDASSGPAGASETTFGLVISPSLAVLENGSEAAILAVLANYDAEVTYGGVVFDNSTTNYATRLGDDGVTYRAALTGQAGITGMLSYLSALNPAAPRVKANAEAVAKMNSVYKLQGKVEAPVITLSATADHVASAGSALYLAQKYAISVDNGISKSGKLLNIWNAPDAEYTKFDAAGSPVTPTGFTNGAGHCKYSTSQIVAVAKLAAAAAKTGKLPSTTAVKAAIKNEPNLFVDPNFAPPLLKFYQ
jgi:pimeloyl-ACP methyl ester carboxylesterase